MWQVASPSGLKTIAQIYRKAIDLDPNDPKAFAGLSSALITEGLVGNISTPLAYTCAQRALLMAMECDPELLEVKSAEAGLKMVLERDWHGARQGFDGVLNQDPEYFLSLSGRALLYIAEGSLPHAIGLLEKGEIKDPLDTIMQALLSWCYYLAGQYDTVRARNATVRNFGGTGAIVNAVDALASVQLEGPDGYIQQVERLAANPQCQPVQQGVLGYAYALSGQAQRAREVLDALTEPRVQAKPHFAYAAALILIGLNEEKKAVECLEQSYVRGSLWSLGFLSDPMLASLRSGPEFQLFLSRVTYPTA
jgi:tetratricopeptide (TPR) repeat protein